MMSAKYGAFIAYGRKIMSKTDSVTSNPENRVLDDSELNAVVGGSMVAAVHMLDGALDGANAGFKSRPVPTHLGLPDLPLL
jgi:hypothetical protein